MDNYELDTLVALEGLGLGPNMYINNDADEFLLYEFEADAYLASLIDEEDAETE